MNLFNIPGLSGYKTAIAGWALLIAGVGQLLVDVGGCLSGQLDVETCYNALKASFNGLTTAATGLGILGLGHKLTK